MKIIAIILSVAVVIAVIGGSGYVFDLESFMTNITAVNTKWLAISNAIGNVWTHDYYDPDSGIDWVDSILGAPFIDVIVNTCYRLIDTTKLLGYFIVSANVTLKTVTPWEYIKPIDNMYSWSDDQYTWNGNGYDGIETFEPSNPNHAGGR